MKLITGLGNPGRSYKDTRHNVGFMVLDRIADDSGFRFKSGKGEYEMAEYSAAGERVIFLKPTTYMNLSGLAVQAVVQYYKTSVADLLVICDDAALPLGKIRARKEGSDGGQKGLRSIIEQLQDDRFPRLRIGIGRHERMDLSDFVLSRFNEDEKPALKSVLETSQKAVMDFISRGIDYVMNQYNGMTIGTKNQ